MNKYKVPIKNVIFMYSYIWDMANKKDYAHLMAEDDFKSSDIYAELFLINIEKIIRRGLYKEYIPKNEELNIVRGKINIVQTINHQSLKIGKVYCDYDDLEENNIFNQIIKYIAIRLYKSSDISYENKKKINRIILYFNKVDRINISKETFKKLVFNKANNYYYYIIKICELIYNTQMLNDEKGKYKFYDLFEDDKTMENIFEMFIYKFYEHELPKKYKVSYQTPIDWKLEGGNQSLLPQMRMDTLIKTQEETIIIDTKYKKNYTNTNQYENEKLVSENMYQMMSYLNNINVENKLRGILLYPLPYSYIPINESYNCKVVSSNPPLADAKIEFITIDLSQDWKNVACDLLYIIDKSLGDLKKEKLNIN